MVLKIRCLIIVVFATSLPLLAQSMPAAVPDVSAAILTPPTPALPRINGPSIFGVRPGHPILNHVPVTGGRPIAYSASGLPAGAALDPTTGQLSGSVETAGSYTITLHVSNAKGSADRAFRLMVGDGIGLTPPMGWNSYNVWSDQITQERVLAAARDNAPWKAVYAKIIPFTEIGHREILSIVG
jgi:alpha-galactosidase